MILGPTPEAFCPALGGAVCVIDSDRGVRGSLQALLATLSVPVVTFPSAEAFLACLELGAPSLLITELALPGMTGFQLLEILRGRDLDIPVLGLTEDWDPEVEEEAARAGVVGLLEKPFLYWAVIQRVQEILGLPN